MATTMTLSRARELADLQRLYVRTGYGRLKETSATAALATLVSAKAKGDVKRIEALRAAVAEFPKHDVA